LRPILTGEERWCQLFSEPGAGSDLAGLTTRAVRDGDRWIVNGQKVWTTSAHHADFGILLARTDWTVPKHQGLTFFILPMAQGGVEVRPLRQMNGYASFNEVFLTDAEVPVDWVVGQVGGGWSVALTTLAHERRFAAAGAASPRGTGRVIDEAQRESAEHAATYKWYPQRAGRSDFVAEHARARGLDKDPIARTNIARLLAITMTSSWTARRAAARRAAGRPPGPEGSIGKLAMSHVARQAAAVHSHLAGATGMLSGENAPFNGTIPEVFVSVPAQSIAGGTDEIQRTILGEKALGLPREPSVDNQIPFNQVGRQR
jgi:alkylation response protein AidB-like acyl-CoA dehydrogenase